MKSKPEGDQPERDLADQYRQFLQDFPRQQATLAGDQGWSWIDSGRGVTINNRRGVTVNNRRGEKTLVLLPGFMGEAETSFLYIQALARMPSKLGHSLSQIPRKPGQMWAQLSDQPGHLRVVSVSYPSSVARVDHFCDGLCALLDHLGIPQAAFLGGSSGGFLAQVFARRAPARVSGLILTHTGLPNPAQARMMQPFLRLLRVLPFEVVRGLLLLSVFAFFPRHTRLHVFWRAHFRSVIRALSREAVLNRFALFADFHRRYRFRADDLVVEPGSILLMEMQRDHLSSAAEQSEMRALYPGAKLHIFSDTAHFDAVEKPDEQIRVIADFINSRN